MAVGEGHVMAMTQHETGGRQWQQQVYVRHPHRDLTTHDPNLCCERNQRHNEETTYNMQRPPGRCHGTRGGTQELGVHHGASLYVSVGHGHAVGGIRARGKRVGGGGCPSVRARGYRVVGPETWGQGCGMRGGEGWKAGVPRVGRQWDVNGRGGGGM